MSGKEHEISVKSFPHFLFTLSTNVHPRFAIGKTLQIASQTVQLRSSPQPALSAGQLPYVISFNPHTTAGEVGDINSVLQMEKQARGDKFTKSRREAALRLFIVLSSHTRARAHHRAGFAAVCSVPAP